MKLFPKLLFLISCFCSFPAYAQITTDGTTSTTLTPTNAGVQIDEGDRAGGNLFHSFGEFAVDVGSEAYFNNPDDVTNIFSRVTGGNISNINGLIRANGTANLFLINPAGIVFGDGARLQLGGSFYGSTADSIIFNDGQFRATDLDNPPLITVNAPIGLGFRDSPGSITVFGDGFGKRFTTDLIDTENALRVNENSTLGLIGGEINFNGATLKTPGGRIELGSVGENQTVSLIYTDNGFTVGYGEVTNFNDVNLLQVSNLDASGIVNGDIKIQGNNINIIEGSVVEASTIGIADESLTSGIIELNAQDTITLDGTEFTNGTSSFIASQIFPDAIGNTGGVTINTGSLNFLAGGQISAAIEGQGNSGNIQIAATDVVTFDGTDLNFFASGIANSVAATGTGNAGTIEITADSFLITNGGQILSSTFGVGNGGNISITATNSLDLDGGNAFISDSGIFSEVSTDAIGNGGDIAINTGSLNVVNGSRITTRTFGNGDAGSITIDAGDTINSSGQNRFNISGLFSEVREGGIGEGGDITISTGFLFLNGGAQINSSTNGMGNAGSITIDATENVVFEGDNSLGIDDSSDLLFVSGAFSNVGFNGEGKAGAIAITADSIGLFDGAQISASIAGITGEDATGSISLTGNDLIILDGSNGVNVGDLNERIAGRNDLVSVSGVFSDLELDGIGQAGNIDINAKSLEVINGAQINSSTFGQGNAGAIAINATETVLLDREDADGNGSGIFSDANSNTMGNGGNIEIDTGSLRVLNGSLIGTSVLPFAQGNAGSISITATDEVILDEGLAFGATGIFSNVAEEGIGNSGNIQISTNSLKILNGSAIVSSTNGLGNAASITIDAKSIVLNFRDRQGSSSGIFTIVEDVATGNSNQIAIATNSLEILNGGQISAATFGRGDAGEINIEAKTISLDGKNTFLILAEDRTLLTNSGIFSDVGVQFDRPNGEAGVGNGGDISITADNLTLTDGGQINAGTSGTGNTGSLSVDVSEHITIDGNNSGLFSAVAESGVGNADNITIDATSLELSNGGQIAASTSGKGNAGSIEITVSENITVDGGGASSESVAGIFSTVEKSAIANSDVDTAQINLTTGSLSLIDGGQISTSTFGNGDSGAIAITASESIIARGKNFFLDSVSGVFSAVESGATGNAGNINLTTNSLRISDRGKIDISDAGISENGATGSITIEANSVALDSGEISAATQAGTGGEVNLEIAEDLSLRNNSLISARAFDEADGGNLTLATRFIFAFPSNGSGSDIIANAERGQGGEIRIDAEQIFNLQERNAINANGDLINNNTNDFDASSESGINGLVTIENTDNNPFRETQELSTDIIATEIITASNACSISDIDRVSSLIVNGKGGILPNPTNPLTSNALIPEGELELSDLSLNSDFANNSSSVQPVAYKNDGEPIYLAKGIVLDEDGTVVLTASSQKKRITSRFKNPYDCR